jgi:peptidoglycan hydrolase-like protein with peptidoglycan-binding domain
MNFRELMDTLDKINKPMLSEALTLSAIIAITSGYEQDDKVRIPKLADLAKQNGLEGLVDPVTGHYISNEGDEDDEVPFEVGQKLAQAGLLPKNARLEQAGWFDNQDVWNKANAGLVDQSSQISGQANDLADKIKKLQELFGKYVELYNKKHSVKTGAAPVAGATPPGIVPQGAQNVMNQAHTMFNNATANMPGMQAAMNNIPGINNIPPAVKESQGLSNALIESFGYNVVTEDATSDLAAKAVGKRIPGLGLAFGAKDAYDRAQKGDWAGAGIAGLSGLASTIPGLGTAASIGLDGVNAVRDYESDDSNDIAPTSNPIAQLQQIIGATPDGKFGPKSAKALSVWQEKNGLIPTGKPDAQTYAKAGIDMKQQTVAESIASLRDRLEAIENQPHLDEGVGDWLKTGYNAAKTAGKEFMGGFNRPDAIRNASQAAAGGVGNPSKAAKIGAGFGNNKLKTGVAAGAIAGAGAMDAANSYDAAHAQTQGQSPVGKHHGGGHGGHGGGSYPPIDPAIQQALKAKGADLGTTGPNGDGVDGVNGPLTQAAIAKFGMPNGQQAQGQQAPAADAADAAGDKEMADLKAQIQAITGELSKSGNADAAKAATDMQAKLSTMQ